MALEFAPATRGRHGGNDRATSAALGVLPNPRLSQAVAGCPCRACALGLRLRRRARPHPGRLVCPSCSRQDRTDGDLDALSARIAEVRTWTYIANRPDWLRDPGHWQSVTRQVEDNLSDALHERLAQRFVDRRTSVLMRRLRENVMLEAEVTPSGDVLVEGQHVGQLIGFHFTADPGGGG